MMRFENASRATTIFSAALILVGIASAARADTALSDRASMVRNAVVAMSLADAAMPVAEAVSTARDDRPALVPASSAAMNPETSSAMASMKTASARNANASYTSTASYERRVRPLRDPFLLILGVAY